MEMLEGTRERATLRLESDESEEEMTNRKEIEEIAKEKLIEMLRKLKKAKTPGEEEIENEVWRFMFKKIGEEF